METATETKSTVQVFQDILKVGGKYTLYRIDEMMAMSHRDEITVTRWLEQGGETLAIFVLRGKRKEYILRPESRHYQSAPLKPLQTAIFTGWNQPFTVDTDKASGCCIMRGNACLNFIGKANEIGAWFTANQMNPFCEKVRVLAIGPEEDGLHPTETVVFPEEYNGQHAVIGNLLARQKTA